MEAEDDHRNKDLFDGIASGSYSPNKRKVESSFGLFCVMRKRARGDISVDDDMYSSDFDYAVKGDDFFCSDSDTDLSECSEFDVISQHVVEDKGLIGSESLSACNSPCLSEDGGNEVRYGDQVVNMQGCMEKVSCNDEPILISSASQQSVRCLSEYNVHDDKFGLGTSPVPLTKTLEGSGRQWSVCGSVAADRKIPLLGDSSGACSSLGEQLDVNVSTSEGRGAELSHTLYPEEDEVDGEDEMSFSDIDAMIRRLNLIPDDSDSCLDMEERNMSKHPRHTLLGLEQCSMTSVPRGIISQGAIAVLHGREFKHFIRKQEVIIGRSSDGVNVDVDLGKCGYGSNISRRQALVKLENNGSFSLKNLGKLHILVNGEKLSTGQSVSLTSCSSVDIRGEVFVFKINKEAVRQFLKNNTRRHNKDDTKFRWCE
ncbi:hypothetical protein N665_0338s0036 [Sinapis alba]|nr:hypothetical protein N665_0338s0036 [Sinapis alba]